MTINELISKQKSLMEKIEKRNGTTGSIPELTSALIAEVGEFLNEDQGFKFWKQNKNIDRLKVKEELIDVLFFYLQIWIKEGFTARELELAYLEKWQENMDRQDRGY